MLFDVMLAKKFKKILDKRLPIVKWLPRYKLKDSVSDMMGGFTVGITMIPQALAYASVAGLPPQYGLYSALIGSFVYIFLGTCKELSIGPTAVIALLTSSYTHRTNPDMAVLLCFLSGCVELLCGIFNLGFLVQFVSLPVVAGFNSAAAIITATSQLKKIFGLQFDSENCLETWRKLVENIHKYNLGDVILGVSCIVVLLSLRRLKYVKIPYDKENPKAGRKRALKKVLRFIAMGRNALVVIVCAAVAYALKKKGDVPFSLAGNIDPGMPQAEVPPFSTTFGNQTYSFIEMCEYLSSGIAIVPIVSTIGNIAIAKAFAHGVIIDSTQEMIALGTCNIVGSFFHSLPIAGSLSRSAVSNASGIRTQMGGLYVGILVILSLSLLTPYFYFIPEATLASVIICSVIFMVEVRMIKPIWGSNKRDLIPAFATFLACLFIAVELGIVIGIVVDVIFLLYFSARPRVLVEKKAILGDLEYILITPSSDLLFPAIDFVREIVAKAGISKHQDKAVVVNCKHMYRADFTAAQGIQDLLQDFRKRNRHVIFHSMRSGVAKMIGRVSAAEFLCSSSGEELTQILTDLRAAPLGLDQESLQIEGYKTLPEEPVLYEAHM
ncbi:sodium-independent sulfate anion transporter [Anabrus simplex]|uniref:sodium-independent sulfate anion transporter n=1 Tax=Anabrus simplex TaxID=316456 RepID=UPI0035A349BA